MRDDVAYEISELYPTRPVDDLHLERLRLRVLNEPSRRRSRAWVGAAAVAAAVVMVGTFVVLQRGPDRIQPVAPVTSLWEAADRLQESPRPDKKYRHLHYTLWKSMTIDGNSPTTVEFVIDVWLPTEDGGKVTVDKHWTGRVRDSTSVPFSQPLQFTEPPKLWGTYCETTPCREKSFELPLTVDPKTKLDSASSRLFSPFSTNREKADTFRELASAPAIHYADGTISVDGGRTSFTIDPVTGRVTGSEQRQIGPGKVPEGTVTDSVTVTEEWTDQRPS